MLSYICYIDYIVWHAFLPTQTYPCGIEWGPVTKWDDSSVTWQLPGREQTLLYGTCKDTKPNCPTDTPPATNTAVNPSPTINPYSTTPNIIPITGIFSPPTISANPRPAVTSSGNDESSGDDESEIQ